MLADPQTQAIAVATPARHPPAGRDGRAARGQARAGGEAARGDLRRGPPARRGGGRARADPHVRPHLLLHPGGEPHPRAVALRRDRRPALPRLGADQPRPGAARHRRDLGPGPARPVGARLRPARRRRAGQRERARQRPDRRRQGLHRLPHAAAEHRRHRARARELAVPDQVAHGHHRRLASAPSSGTTSTPCTALGDLRPRRGRRRAGRAGRGGAARPAHLVPLRRHGRARPARTGGAADHGRGVRRRHPHRHPAPTDGRAGLRVLQILEAASTQPRQRRRGGRAGGGR